MQSNGGLAEAHALPGQGRDPVRPRRRHRRRGAHRRDWPGSTASSASTWAAPRPTSRTTPGGFERAFETAGRRRAHARADDGDPHGRRRRRLDPAFRRRALPRRARIRAGADPGPACYRRGGPLTVTDANVMRRQDPAGVLPGGVRPERRSAARRRRRARALRRAGRGDRRRRPARRARPSRSPRGSCGSPSPTWPTRSSRSRCSAATTSTRFTLACFGGAGGQHACLVADALGMETVFIHPLAGVLSAYGMGLADQSVMREQAVEAALNRRCCRSLKTSPTAGGRGARGADRARRRCGAHRRARARRICATRAPKPRCRCRCDGTRACVADFDRRRTARASASLTPERRAGGRGGRRSRRSPPARR